ncbi:Cytosine/adenosine deaminase [Tardiphaga sp. OK246]|jgi:cytosine/adenosine deaminase-related metal-dependent hydrolase|nr:Cytosine/adenosine deaminase [Tardiphaga sp. OK246]
MSQVQRTLITGGRILDPDGELDRPPVADVLIIDGRIVAIGPEGKLDAGEDARVIDARGKLVTPGFINAHYHSHDVLLRGMFEQMPLEVWGLYSFPSNYPRRSDEEVRVRTLLGAVENLRCGVTTVQDMVSIVGPDQRHMDAVLSAYQEAGIRAVLALQLGDKAAADTVPFWREELSADALRELGGSLDPRPMQHFVASLLDAPRSERVSWALAPSAPQRCSEQLLQWTAQMAADRALRVFTHLYETRSQALLARLAYEGDHRSLVSFLDRLGLLSDRLTIAHGVWISDHEIAQLGAAGVNLAFNPISNLKLLNGIAPIRRYAEVGVNVALGCDNCSGSDSQNIFESMKAFALYWALQGEAGEAGAARAAFRAATIGGAKALGCEADLGAIRPGAKADLVLISLDDPAFVPLNSAVRQLVYAGTPRAIDTVLVAGEPVVVDGRTTRMTQQSVMAAAAGVQACLCEEYHAVSARLDPVAREILGVHRKIECQPIDIDRLRLRDSKAPGLMIRAGKT